MKYLFVIFFTIVYATSFSQRPAKLKIIKNKQNTPYSYIEEFQVLKKEPGIKNGWYTKESFGTLIETGQFENGEKVGVWAIYGLEQISHKYDYDNQEVIYIPTAQSENQVNESENATPVILKKGAAHLLRCVYSNIMYPAEAREGGISGQVLIEWDVSANGEIGDIKIQKGVHPILDEEALRIVTKFKSELECYPATKNGINVDGKYSIPINFRLA